MGGQGHPHFSNKVTPLRQVLVKGPLWEGRGCSWAGEAGRNFLKKWGRKGCFQQGVCEGTVHPATPGIVHSLCWAPSRPAIVTGAPPAPGLSTGCIFPTLHPSEKTSKPREMCFLLCLVSDAQHVASRAKLRHLLTYSVQLRPELYLSIRETIVTDNLPAAEKKLCILSHKSCRSIAVLDETL